ncbi:hypothetical protein [Maridesulfovibrio sp.]|uniref:hypothetical protein n=1 Tax=Maridesulfovibrio sp. TaxID=2795000 RepID=UPI003BA96D43
MSEKNNFGKQKYENEVFKSKKDLSQDTEQVKHPPKGNISGLQSNRTQTTQNTNLIAFKSN